MTCFDPEGRILGRWLFAGVLALAFCLPRVDRAWSAPAMPHAPCESGVFPPYSAPGQAPSVRVWYRRELRDSNWRPPACLSWAGSSNIVVAVAGSFRANATIDQLLERLGRISAYPSILYWSAKAESWKPLAKAAWAVEGTDPGNRRVDFSGQEIRSGAELHYAELGEKTGTVLYRIQTVSYSADHAVVAIENVSPMRLGFLPLFDPGALQTTLFFDRLGADVWGLYQLTRTADGTSFLAGGHEGSYINRDEAIFYYFAPDAAARSAPAPQ